MDDAVVGVENVQRRLQLNRSQKPPKPTLAAIAAATLEVRSAIMYATVIIVLVFVPLFALPGIEGRLFSPLGVAYIVSILCSLVVSITLTPVLAYYLLPKTLLQHRAESRLVGWLKHHTQRLLHWGFHHSRSLLMCTCIGLVITLSSLAILPKHFLPPFNEGTLTLSLTLNPGTSLEDANRLGTLAETLLLQIPEVAQVGRRTGRAELDEHAEGIHASELEVDLKPSHRSRQAVLDHIRQQLAALPANLSIGQPISHRLDHLLSGVRAQVALKIYGPELDTLRAQAQQLQQGLSRVPGITDLNLEKQVLIPQINLRIHYAQASRYGLTPNTLAQQLQHLLEGATLSRIQEGNRQFNLVLKLKDPQRHPQALEQLLINTPAGPVPLNTLAEIEETLGPNQIVRENSQRRIVLAANTDGRDLATIISNIRNLLAQHPLPEGYFTALEGQFQAQEEASQRMAGLGVLSLLLIFVVLYSRYSSTRLALIIMANIPLALIGSIAALWLAGQPLSIAALVGFITLAGIATRNGILKISHYINLCAFEGETFSQQLIIRGTLERLTPVLMTALVAAFALVPLLVSAHAPGKEILHPVAVVIFGGLISSTLLDTLITPLLFWHFGKKPLQHILNTQEHPTLF